MRRFAFCRKAQEDLGHFHRNEGEEGERDHDEILLRVEIDQLEEVHDAGDEGDERHDDQRASDGEHEHLVVSLPGLEDAVRVGALVDGVDELREREHHEGHGHCDGVFLFGGGTVARLRDPIGGEGGQRDDDTVDDYAHNDPSFKEGAALHGRNFHHVAVRGIDAERYGGQGVRGEVDEQDVDGEDGILPPEAECEEEGEDLRDIARDQELDHLLDVAVDPPAFADRLFDGGEIVVEEDHIRRVLGDVRARDAHRDADVRLFEGGAVVDAVPRHRGDFARAFEGLYYAQLVRGGHSCEHHRVAHGGIELLVGHTVQFRPRDDGVAGAEDVQLLGDGEGGDLVVSRDHNDADARLVAGVHGADDFAAGRIDHPRHSHEGHVELDVLVVREREGGESAHRKAQHAQCVPAHLLAERAYRGSVVGGHFAHAVVVEDVRAEGEHLVHRALGVGGESALDVVHRGHALAVGVEGLFKQFRVFIFTFSLVNPMNARKRDERALRWIAEGLPLAVGVEGGVAAERAGIGQCRFGRLGQSVEVLCRDGLAAEHPARRGDVSDRHPVEGEGARLVAADDGGAAQRFHRGQTFDKGVALRHALYAERHYDGGCGGQTFGDDGDGERDAEQHQGLPCPAAPCKADRHDDDADGEPYDGEDLAHRVEFLFDGGLEVVLLFEHIGDLPHLRCGASCGDHARRVAVHHDGGGISHVDPVAEGSVGGEHRVRVLFRGDGFACERGFLHAQIVVRKQPDVRGDDGAVLEIDDVARDELACGDEALLAVTQHARDGRGHTFQCGEGVGGFLFLDDAHRGVERDDRKDDDAFREPFAVYGVHHEREHHGDEQDDDHDVRKLLEDHAPYAFGLDVSEGVAPVLFKARPRLRIGQTFRRGREQFFRLVDGEGVPQRAWVWVVVHCFLR